MKKITKEKINFIIPEPAQKEPESLNPSSHYQEMLDIREQNLDTSIENDEKMAYISMFLENYVKLIEEVLQSFYFMELFYVSINKDKKVSLIRTELKERINKLSSFTSEINKKFIDGISEKELNSLYLET
ncbi:MAG TPA: hypothetical protein GX695_03035, partial [Acholeplasmataceae bacterium]|nr:hypothetical protein [Acholeplasmataceae bacterium]